MQDRPELELVLRRLQAERKKGTSIEEIFDIVRSMLQSQRLADENQTPPESDAGAPGGD